MKRISGFFILSLMFIYACNDFLIPNIGEENVDVIIPVDNFQSNSTLVQFKWHEVEGAEQYQLQIVSPSFTSIAIFPIDTLVAKPEVYLRLNEGNYEWRIRAINGVSSTEFQTYALQVGSNDSLDSQSVGLLNPAAGAARADSVIQFSWTSLDGADDYRFEAVSGGSSIGPFITTETFINLNLAEGNYTWKVRASNSFSSTGFSERTLIVDRTAPLAPTLDFPVYNDTLTAGSTSMLWTRPTDGGSAINDSIFIYSDSLSTLILADEAAGTFYTEVLSTGTYYWRVRSIDEAGNRSTLSAVGKFNIQ